MIALLNAIGEWINANLSGPLTTLFYPTNAALGALDNPFIWKVCAVGMFFATMVWVFTLKKEYVNLNAPRKNIFYDLRLWTIVSMLPHVLIYFWLGT